MYANPKLIKCQSCQKASLVCCVSVNCTVDQLTHVVAGRGSLALCFALASHRCGAAASRLLVVELQILEPLR